MKVQDSNTQGTKIRTVLVDEQPVFRQGLRAILSPDLHFDVVGDHAGPIDVIELVQNQDVDLFILDILLPGTNGVALTSALKRVHPGCRVLGLSMLVEPARIAELIRAGANGYALKTQSPAEITSAIEIVMGGGRYLPPSIAPDELDTLIHSDDAWPLRRLTTREREIFDLLVSGHTNDDIAMRLFIARRTVETHRQHIMKKVGARSLVELIRIGVKYGIQTTISPPSA